MRIIYFDRNCKIHGATTFVLCLSEALVKRGHEFTYAARGGPLAPLFRQAGARLLTTQSKPINRWQVARHMRGHAYDVLFCSGRGQTDVAISLAAEAGLPAICFFQDPLEPGDTLERLLHPAALVSVEPPIHESVLALGVPAERAIFLPRPIRARPFGPPPDNEFSVSYIGRLSGWKQIVPPCMIAAAPEIAAEVPGLRINIVGGGSKYRAVRAAARAVNSAIGREVVRMRGITLDPLGWMERSHVVVAGGYACMEALYNGRAGIGAGFGWFGPVSRGHVEEGVALHFGDRSQIVNDPRRMRDALVEMYRALGDPEQARQYVGLREEFVDDHSPEAIAATVERLCEKVIGAG